MRGSAPRRGSTATFGTRKPPPCHIRQAGVELVSVAWNPTLNFRVPAWYVRAGQTTAVVRLWLTSGEGGTATASESFQVIPVNAPKVALVRVNWKNTATNTVTSPSDSDLLGLCALAARMLPFPYFETTILGVEQTKSGDFSGPPLNADGSPEPRWLQCRLGRPAHRDSR